ncbi:MAG TPA: hypothetical protein VIL49_15750 [Capillimicrobium sp.]
MGGPAAPEADFPGLNADWVEWGFECGAQGYPTCGTGATLHQAWAVIYSSTVTLVDNQAPSEPAVAGALVSPGWKRGAVGAELTASDNLGIRTIRWYADGAPVPGSATTRTCDFSTRVPCSGLAAAPSALDTAALADGQRTVEAGVVDPAGNETRSASVVVAVDNTAPGPPTALQASGGGGSPSFTLAWTNPPAGAGSPLAQAAWEACPTSGAGACASGAGTLAGAGGSAAGTLPSPGSYTVSVWLTDAAGNGTAANAATTTVAYTPVPSGGGGGGGGGGTPKPPDQRPGPTPPAPPDAPAPPAPPVVGPPVAPPVGRHPAELVIARAARTSDGRALRVRGTLHPGATGSVRLTLQATTGGRLARASTRAPIAGGRFAARVELAPRLRTARAIRVSVRYAGSPTVAPGRAGARVARAGGPAG